MRSEWLDPRYLDGWPFEIITENAMSSIPLKNLYSNNGRNRTSSFLQNIVGSTGRVDWCLGSYITTVPVPGEKGVFPQVNEDRSL